MKVWILSCPEAIDTHGEIIAPSEIIAVFSTEEKAFEAYNQLPENSIRTRSDYYIHEYDLDAF